VTRTARRIAAPRLIAALLALIAIALAPVAQAQAEAQAAKPRASLTEIESEVMCTACREPLAVAQSPEADQERDYIRTLIAQGLTKKQIEQNLVAQYGVGVLGRPPAHGFNLSIYLLPPAILIVGIAIIAVTLPRWRRRTRAAALDPDQPLPPLDPLEQERLDKELSQFRG
jgi:cytochrome c-type biogenesis protein CcmH